MIEKLEEIIAGGGGVGGGGETRWKDKKGKTEKMTQSRRDRSDTETHLGTHTDWQISWGHVRKSRAVYTSVCVSAASVTGKR